VASTDSKRDLTSSEEPDFDNRLLHVKRIFIESFGDDVISKQVQAMVISSLTESKRFIVTENKERADAILKGTGLERISNEFHSNSEGTAAGGVGGAFSDGAGSVAGRAAAIEDSNASTETINDARVSLRLVDKDGDVLWATTQESKGAKYRGASADVAEKVVKQLLRDVEKLKKKAAVMDAPK
jgi:curli biogenesis system outer membrane secretion channel CsgG